MFRFAAFGEVRFLVEVPLASQLTFVQRPPAQAQKSLVFGVPSGLETMEAGDLGHGTKWNG